MGSLNVVCGNILDYLDNKDLIINSANKYMTYGSGVCGLIYKSADKKLLEEYCKNNYSEYMKVNEIRITPGFNLDIDILHIYCPKSYENKNSIDELVDSYINIFISAKEKDYKSIVSASIGTGTHGYKHSDIANNVISILNDLVYKYDVGFTLVLPSEDIINIYQNIKTLTLEELKKLSNEEKRKRYIELSPKDKHIFRITDPSPFLNAETIGYVEMTEEEKINNEIKKKEIMKAIRRNKEKLAQTND